MTFMRSGGGVPPLYDLTDDLTETIATETKNSSLYAGNLVF